MENLLNFKKQYGPWALISGASSGIGRELAKKTAELGLNTILVARRESRLSELAAEIGERFDIETRIVSVDLSQDNFLEKIEEATEGLEVGLLINNAAADPGIMGDFVDNELSYELSTLNVNCRAPLMLTHKFGKYMKSRRRGGLIFVSALLSMTAGGPMLSNYFATKAFNLFFGEGLETEFKKHNVDVLVLCPGPTQTELYARVFKEFMTMNANVVARTALKNLGRKSRVVPGFLNRFQISFLKLLPRSLLKTIVAKLVVYLKK